MSEIKPALTAEEWAERTYAGSDIVVSIARPALDGSPRLHLNVYAHPVGSGVTGEPRDLHALAALALYGQPFGLTREDVTILRQLPATVRGIGMGHGTLAEGEENIRHWMRGLAARIEALLPPEEK